MAVILQVDFPSEGPFGESMSQAYRELAESINLETGMLWKIWTENSQTQEAGGIYLFDHAANAERYLKMQSARLESFGLKNTWQDFEVNAALFAINQADFLSR